MPSIPGSILPADFTNGGILSDILSLPRDSRFHRADLSLPSPGRTSSSSNRRESSSSIRAASRTSRKNSRAISRAKQAPLTGISKRSSRSAAGPRRSISTQTCIAPPNLDEDYLSLDAVLKDLTADTAPARACSPAMPCATASGPTRFLLPITAGWCLSFYESIACVKGGGDAFIRPFRTKFKEYDVEVRCERLDRGTGRHQRQQVGRFVLNTGEEVTADTCVFTIHPEEIVKILPAKHFSRAFANRVSSFESSAGSFPSSPSLKPGAEIPYPEQRPSFRFSRTRTSTCCSTPAIPGIPALVIIKSPENRRRHGKAICILEPSFPEHVSEWSGSRRGKRPQEYLDYKKTRVEAIKEHVFSVFPAYRETLDFVDAGFVADLQGLSEQPRRQRVRRQAEDGAVQCDRQASRCTICCRRPERSLARVSSAR